MCSEFECSQIVFIDEDIQIQPFLLSATTSYKRSQQVQVNMDQRLSPTSRGSFNFASLRIKKRHHSHDESGFAGRRNLTNFLSARESLKKESTKDEGANIQPLVKEPGEQPKGNLLSDGSGKQNAIPSGEEDGRQGPLKRFSAMWSSFRKGKKDKIKDTESAELPVPAVAESTSRQPRYVSGQYFFEYLVVVSLKKNDGSIYEPQITYQHPKKDIMAKCQREEEAKILKAITLFCFPEGINWEPLTEYHSETFSFVLTEIDGSRRNGYCRRLLPGGRGARPPEAYCIISKLACFGLFSKIFDEVEKRRQISMAMIHPFMQKLREAPFPAPGNTVEIKSFIPESGTEIIRLTRPLDSWLEHVNFAKLFGCLTDEEVLLVFAAAVLERRIIFIAEELGTLSQVIHAVAALLYPFTWQHTFISIVPKILIDVVMAPTPYLLGVQKQLLDQVTDQGDLLVVDLSKNKRKTFIVSIGDEDSILPSKLQSEILEALQSKRKASTEEELNRVVSEAFLLFFVKTVGHFSSYVKYSRTGEPGVFEKRRFYKAIESKTTRHFVKNFIQTQMFDLFIQEVEQQQPGPQQGVFHQKILEHQERKKREKKRH
ncbi:DENN domain-containing protein 2D-like isoform X1 [Gouania willdenowi]|uniref:UDENN domain-containing protein n=1 Tax=Gouania willdenowi TaxID=441366 RepID=A0A8C5E2H1_GOUWI|nr:DENN domain-containing protein 2D isoform X1 [Gouania willdenowi]XP_028308929.1 DENN domain-containing protein 2D isoform X1 [Gouania willdenowi]XP_028308930.1 DENN domain-containing protein 2D isoform X1 [Gouania willdenowi]